MARDWCQRQFLYYKLIFFCAKSKTLHPHNHHCCWSLVKMTVAQYFEDLRLAGGDPELMRIAYAAFRERDTANRNEQYTAAVARGLPKGQGWRGLPSPKASGYLSWQIYSPDGEQVSLKDALQKAGVGNGENVRIFQWLKTEEDMLKAYLDQRMIIKRIKMLMGIGYDCLEKKIKEEGWLVWKGRSKNGCFTKI